MRACPSIVATMHSSDDRDTLIHQVRARQLAALAAMVAITLTTASFVRLPGRTVLLRALGSEISYEFSGAAQYTLLLGGIVCSGLVAVLRAGQRARSLTFAEAASFWGLPLQVVLVALSVLDQLSWWGFQIGIAVLTGMLLAIIVALQTQSAERDVSRARLMLNAITYALSLLVFAAIYAMRLRSMLSATALAVSATLLSAELLRDTDTPISQVWGWSALVGLLIGEMTWALNYTRMSTRSGAVLLLAAFYALSGIIQQHLWRRLDRRGAIEFLIALLIGVAVASALA